MWYIVDYIAKNYYYYLLATKARTNTTKENTAWEVIVYDNQSQETATARPYTVCMVVSSSLLPITMSRVVQALAGRRVMPPTPSTAWLVPQLTTAVVEADLDTLDVVVIAGEALGVVAVADVTIGVLWATEAADDAFDALEAPEATGAADDAPVAMGVVDDDVGLLEAIGRVDVATGLLEAIGLLAAVRAKEVDKELLETTGTAIDVAVELLEGIGATDIAIELLEDGTIELLGITAAMDVAFKLLEATGTTTDDIELLETAGTVDEADELLKLTGVAPGADELLTITGAVEIVVMMLEATGAEEEAIELLELKGDDTEELGITEAVDEAGVLLGTTGAIDIPIVLLDATTIFEDGRSELDTETIWLTETGWDGVIVELVTVIAGVLWGTIALDVVGAVEETVWLDELTTTVTVFRGKPLEVEMIEGITLDAEFVMLGSMTLDAEVETTWLDALLTGAWEVADDVEGLDPGVTLVAPTTTAILVVGVDKMIGTELVTLTATVTMLDDDTTWIVGLLITWAADVGRLELAEALWTDELGTITAMLVAVSGTGVVEELKPLLIRVTALVAVLLNTDEVAWLGTLLDWARTGDTLPRPVLSGIAWAVLAALDTPW
jgi:hypothetical protein